MKTAKLSAAIAAVMFGTIAAGTAQAATGASAESIVTLNNFTISHQGGAILDTTDFSSLTNSASESPLADLNGVVSAPATVSSDTNYLANPPALPEGSPLSNTAQVGTAPAAISSFFAPGGNTPGTAFTSIYPLPMNTNFSGSVTNSLGAPITGLIGNPTNAAANVNNASYASLNTTGAAFTNTTSTVTAGFKFKTTKDGVMDFSFDFGAYLNNYLELGHGTVAKSSYALQMALLDGAGNSLLDITSGKVGGFATASIFDTNNSLSITNNRSDNAPGDGLQLDRFFPASNDNVNGLLNTIKVQFSTLSLAADTFYDFTATITTNAEVKYVPEPGMLALMGIGLIGLGAASRKAQKSAHVIA